MNKIMVANYRDDETKVPNDRTDEAFVEKVKLLGSREWARLGVSEITNFWIQGEYGHVQD